MGDTLSSPGSWGARTPRKNFECALLSLQLEQPQTTPEFIENGCGFVSYLKVSLTALQQKRSLEKSIKMSPGVRARCPEVKKWLKLQLGNIKPMIKKISCI